MTGSLISVRKVIASFPVFIQKLKEASKKRNEIMVEIADEVFIAYASPNGKLIQLIKQFPEKGKRFFTFDVSENKFILESGAVGYL